MFILSYLNMWKNEMWETQVAFNNLLKQQLVTKTKTKSPSSLFSYVSHII